MDHFLPSRTKPAAKGSHWLTWKIRILLILCQVYVFLLILVVPLVCLFLSNSVPAVEPISFKVTCMLAVYFYLAIICNWIRFRKNLVNANGKCLATWNDGTKTLVTCGKCNVTFPATVHVSHCPICEICISRRDHHCYFLGKCVASCNLLHFVAICFHGAWGSGYSLLILMRYLSLEFGHLWSSGFTYYVIPYATIRWFSSEVTTVNLCSVVLANALLMVLVSAGGMLLFHLYLVFRWKTSYEYWNRAETFRSSSLSNFRRAFGENWVLSIVSIPNVFCTTGCNRLHKPFYDETKHV